MKRIIGLLMLAALVPVVGCATPLGTVTNNASFGTRRALWNAAVLQTNTNTWNIATNAVAIASNTNRLGNLEGQTNLIHSAVQTSAPDFGGNTVSNMGSMVWDESVKIDYTPGFGLDMDGSLGVDGYILTTFGYTNGTILDDLFIYPFGVNNTLYLQLSGTNAVQAAASNLVAGTLGTMAYAASNDYPTLVVMTNAYEAGDVALSNALAGATGDGGVSVAPVSPFKLVCSYTFDDAITNDWWGDVNMTINGSVESFFDEVHGGVMAYTNETAYAGMTSDAGGVDFGSNWTVSAWVNMTNATDDVAVWGIDYDTESLYISVKFKYVSSAWEVAYSYSDATYGWGNSYDLPAGWTGAWEHVVMVQDGSDLFCYLNGEQVVTDTGLNGYDVDGTLFVGCYYDTQTSKLHELDNFHVFDRAFTSNEVVRVYQLESVGQYGVQGFAKTDPFTASEATNIAAYVVSASNSLYATSAQGALADTAVQSADGIAYTNTWLDVDGITNTAGFVDGQATSWTTNGVSL